MEQLAESYWGSLGPAAMPGLSKTEFDAGFGESTATVLPSRAAPAPRLGMTYFGTICVPSVQPRGVHHTFDVSNCVQTRLPGQSRLHLIFSQILKDDTGEGITMMMRIDAIRFLSKIPAGIAMPRVELGIEEITFEWRNNKDAATASVEGDGLLGYALKRGGRFVPGEGPEELSVDPLPKDLLSYLERFPID